MRLGPVRTALRLAVVAQLLAGCPSAEDPPAGDDVDTWAPGLEKPGEEGLFGVRLLDAEPAPPDRGDNEWTVLALGAGGDPLAEASLRVSPWMPDHGHGTTPADFEGRPSGEAGTFEVGPFNLFMPGLWEVTVEVTGPGGGEDRAVFRFDVEG